MTGTTKPLDAAAPGGAGETDRRGALPRSMLSYRGGRVAAASVAVPEETPLALVYDGGTQAVMMGTPADLEDFAVGFSLSEGVIDDPAEIERLEIVEHAAEKEGAPAGVELRCWLAAGKAEPLRQRRRRIAGPVGCGLCGVESLEEALRPVPPLPPSAIRLSPEEIADAMEGLRGAQRLHDRTHGAHAAGLYRPGAGVILAREDVGRHNALDKLIGAMARQGLSGADGAVVLTSRVSVEMAQKCAVAGCSVLIAGSAPTALAIRQAEEAGITLIARVRGDGFDVYAHPGRVALP